MEILCPAAPYLHSSGLFMEQSSRRNSGGRWTHEENKRFENALAKFDEGTPDRWEKVASLIPGKTADDVKRHYRDLEADVSHIDAGLISPPGYGSPHFRLDWVNIQTQEEGLKWSHVEGGKRPAGGRSCCNQERKKGVPWTEDEHKRFLVGLKECGKGDWRTISRKFVVSRTPTQVASHAQKYFIRRSASGKDKRRPSIHDITTADVVVDDTARPSPPRRPLQTTTSAAISPCFSSLLVGPSTTPSSHIHNPTWAVSRMQVQGDLLFLGPPPPPPPPPPPHHTDSSYSPVSPPPPPPPPPSVRVGAHQISHLGLFHNSSMLRRQTGLFQM